MIRIDHGEGVGVVWAGKTNKIGVLAIVFYRTNPATEWTAKAKARRKVGTKTIFKREWPHLWARELLVPKNHQKLRPPLKKAQERPLACPPAYERSMTNRG